MSRLSSTKATFFYKRIFPFLWFGVLLLIIAFGLLSPSRGSQASNIPFLIVPVLMGVFGYRFMQKMVFGLADEVLDAGDALVVRNGGQEERISLSDIKNVNYSPYMSPPQVTLSLRRHTVFGDTVVFCGPVSLVPFSSSPVINDLIDRIDTAHQKR
jgi:hypothetical protein